MYFILNICLILLVCSFIPVWFESHGGLPQPGHRTKTSTPLSQYLIGYVGFIIRDSVMMILSAGLAFALRLSRERENVRRRELELNAERRQIELKSLKAQLNPHFLFNSLNNIYALIGFAPERAQKALHDLSSLLRYMIYDSSSPLVPLQKEISFISEYVELMKLRLNGNVVLKCDIQSGMPQDFHIAPLLFLTLVENAFKHLGTSSGETFIAISIHIDSHRLICSVRNSYSQNEKSRVGDERPSGVGLENVKRQLNLLYPEEYTMSAIGEKGVFSALLAIETVALKGNNSTDKNVFL